MFENVNLSAGIISPVVELLKDFLFTDSFDSSASCFGFVAGDSY